MPARTYINPEGCTKIGQFIDDPRAGYRSRECTIEGTLYGYYPNLGANLLFTIVFAICLIANLGLGIKYKTWTYMIATVLGCLLEVVGYIGRVIMHGDPFNDIGFQLQIALLIIAPAFLSAGVYLTLKYTIINVGEKWSRLRPAWYTYIFITGDIVSLVLQGAGGGLAATADPGSSSQDLGTNLMIAGVIFQVVMLSIFGLAVAEYALRSYRHRDSLDHHALALLQNTRFRIFCGAIFTAYFTIFIRCIYRIPELTGGWGSELMRNEPEFIVLEGVMIMIAGVALTVCHPGIFFPQMTPAGQTEYRSAKNMEGGNSDTEMLPQGRV